jgi:hypothetical protein
MKSLNDAELAGLGPDQLIRLIRDLENEIARLEIERDTYKEAAHDLAAMATRELHRP